MGDDEQRRYSCLGHSNRLWPVENPDLVFHVNG